MSSLFFKIFFAADQRQRWPGVDAVLKVRSTKFYKLYDHCQAREVL